jgi:uncharacterized membrane protein YsdA (DUF1294 family)
VTQRRRPLRTAGRSAFLLLVLAYAAALVWGVWTHRLPWWVLAALPALNLVTFFAYWQDKYAAQQDQWRIAESNLHFWSLAGGWVGAWIAQQLLQHKTRKASFQEVFWFTVAAHCALLGAWFWWNVP